jgi:hypothetical protein
MKYKQRLRVSPRSPAAFLRRHFRRSSYRMTYQDTRRAQQNPMRWLCLWYRRREIVAARSRLTRRTDVLA